MPSLISANDLLQIQVALENTMDTFFTLPVTYYKAVNMPNRFGEMEANTFEEFELLAFYKESNNQTDTVDTSENGSFDDGDGYFLISFLKMQEAGLIVDGLPNLNPSTDYIRANNKEYEVMAVPPLGLFIERFEVVKIIVKKTPNVV